MLWASQMTFQRKISETDISNPGQKKKKVAWIDIARGKLENVSFLLGELTRLDLDGNLFLTALIRAQFIYLFVQ